MGLEDKLEEEKVSEEEVIKKIFQLLKKLKECEDEEEAKGVLIKIRKLLSFLPAQTRKAVLKKIFSELKGSESISGGSIPLPSPEAIRERRLLQRGMKKDTSDLIDQLDTDSPTQLPSTSDEEEEGADIESLYSTGGESAYETGYLETPEPSGLYEEEEMMTETEEGMGEMGGAYEAEDMKTRGRGEVEETYQEKERPKKEEEEIGYLE